LAGFPVITTLPLGVVMAQTLEHRARSMVASLIMGLGWSLSATISPLVRKLADIFSIGVNAMRMTE